MTHTPPTRNDSSLPTDTAPPSSGIDIIHVAEWLGPINGFDLMAEVISHVAAEDLINCALVNKGWAWLVLGEAGVVNLQSADKFTPREFDLQLARFAPPGTKFPESYKSQVKHKRLAFERISDSQRKRALGLLGNSGHGWRRQAQQSDSSDPLKPRFDALLAAAMALFPEELGAALKGPMAMLKCLRADTDELLEGLKSVESAAQKIRDSKSKAEFAKDLGQAVACVKALSLAALQRASACVRSIAQDTQWPGTTEEADTQRSIAACGMAWMVHAACSTPDLRDKAFHTCWQEYCDHVAGLAPKVAVKSMKLIASRTGHMPLRNDIDDTVYRYLLRWGRQHSGEVLGAMLLGFDYELESLSDHGLPFESRARDGLDTDMRNTVVALETWLPQSEPRHRLAVMKAFFSASETVLAPGWLAGLIGIAVRYLDSLDDEDQKEFLAHVEQSLPKHKNGQASRDALRESARGCRQETREAIDRVR